MNEYRAKLNKNGRIIIPVACRKMLHLEPGEELIIRIENNELHLLSLKLSLKRAQSLVKQYAKDQSLTEKLAALRREDEQNE